MKTLFLIGICSLASMPTNALDPPQILFGKLFVDVQEAKIYPDSKVFADATPNAGPSLILERYGALSLRSPSALDAFVAANFSLPEKIVAKPSPPDRVSITEHIDDLWTILTRSSNSSAPYSSLLSVPQPYVVPGGRFREMYYWDSYFSMLGLAASGRQDLVIAMVRNFSYLIDTYGHVPNGTRTYYLSRSQPPFFFEMVSLLNTTRPAAAYDRYLPQLRREYAFWMDGERGLRPGAAYRRVVAMPAGSILNRYWDDRDTPRDESYREDTELARSSQRPAALLYRDIRAAAESGWDFSSRWFADGRSITTLYTSEIIPIDLNSLLFGLEKAIQSGCEHRGDSACATTFRLRADARRRAINRYLWDPTAGVFLDYHWPKAKRVQRLSAASLYPLFTALATDRQAAAVARSVETNLLQPGGLVTTTLRTGEQWDSPNGWSPLQWIAISGLRHYGKLRLAESIACRWMTNVASLYHKSGKLVEKYDVVSPGHNGGGGEYPLQDGFGWTNGVMRRLIALYPKEATFEDFSKCSKVPYDAIRFSGHYLKPLDRRNFDNTVKPGAR